MAPAAVSRVSLWLTQEVAGIAVAHSGYDFMPGCLEDLFNTRTDNDRNGTVRSEWNRILLWRDLERLVAKGFVAPIECPGAGDADFRQRKCFRELSTGDVYVYVEGWERGCPEFRKQKHDSC